MKKKLDKLEVKLMRKVTCYQRQCDACKSPNTLKFYCAFAKLTEARSQWKLIRDARELLLKYEVI